MGNDATQTEMQEFVYSVSHDFRRPMQQIKTIAELLSDRLDGTMDAESAELFEYLGLAADSALLMINRLLEFSRLSTRERTARKIDLAQLATSIVNHEAALRERADRPMVEITIDAPVTINADVDLLRILISELLTNALCYGKGSPVAIAADEEGGQIVLSVRDHGKGIPPEHLDVALRPFGRLEAEDLDHVGLGLNCCLRSAKILGGSIEFVDAAPGLKAIIRLPKGDKV